jgi:prepilin-type N-terminal cleavage/methylation domain-containing protein
MIDRARVRDRRGFSLMEMMLVVALTGIVAAIAIPMMGNTLGFYRLSGDARSAANAVALAKMRAASVFGKVRMYVDRPGRSFHIQTWSGAGPTCCWVSDGGNTYLSRGVTFGFGAVGAAPPNTQGTIAEAADCRDDLGVAIADTSCLTFNSRGIPIDSTGNPAVDAVYVTDGTAVYGITVAATGMIRTWQTPPTATPAWTLQ